LIDAATRDLDSQVIEVDGEEIVKYSISTQVLNKMFPIPKRREI
jgi:hypothetical protein